MAVGGMKLNNSTRLVRKEEKISEWTYVTMHNFLNMPGACLTYPLKYCFDYVTILNVREKRRRKWP
jgi:hypothetical protein